MAERTIDLLLSLQTKDTSAKDLTSKFKELEDSAKRYGQALTKAEKELGANSKEAKILRDGLDKVEQEMRDINAQASRMVLDKKLKDAAARANQLRERMEKVQQVAQRMTIAGGAILAPLALAMNKWAEAQKALDPSQQSEDYKQLANLQMRWNDSMIRMGAVVADQVLPHLETAMGYVEQAVGWLERNPEAVKVLLGAGATLLTAGAVLGTVAQVVSTIATVKGLAAGAGLIGGGSAAGATGTAAAGLGGAGISAALAPALVTALQVVGIAAFIIIAAEATRQFMNWMLGTDTTWGEIGNTLAQLIVITAEFMDAMAAFLGFDTNLSAQVADALGIADVPKQKQITDEAQKSREAWASGFQNLGGIIGKLFNPLSAINQTLGGIPAALSNAIAGPLQGIFQSIAGYAEGGEIPAGPGLFVGGERGREFVMNNQTTRAAENIIGGKLSQDSLLSALGARRVSYYDNRRIDSSLSASDRRLIRDDVLTALRGAI